jgi:hypothetical protein
MRAGGARDLHVGGCVEADLRRDHSHADEPCCARADWAHDMIETDWLPSFVVPLSQVTFLPDPESPDNSPAA